MTYSLYIKKNLSNYTDKNSYTCKDITNTSDINTDDYSYEIVYKIQLLLRFIDRSVVGVKPQFKHP